jgi:hypothetical protein
MGKGFTDAGRRKAVKTWSMKRAKTMATNDNALAAKLPLTGWFTTAAIRSLWGLSDHYLMQRIQHLVLAGYLHRVKVGWYRRLK